MEYKTGDLLRMCEDQDWYPNPEDPYPSEGFWPEGTSFVIDFIERDFDDDDGSYYRIYLRALLNGQIIEVDNDLVDDCMEKL